MKNLMLTSLIFIMSAHAFASQCTVGASLLVTDEKAFLQLQAESKTKGDGMNEMFEMLFKIHALAGGLDIEGSVLEINSAPGNSIFKMKMSTADIENISNDPDKISDNFSTVAYAEFQKLQAEIKAAPKSIRDLNGECKIKPSEKDILLCGDAESTLN